MRIWDPNASNIKQKFLKISITQILEMIYTSFQILIQINSSTNSAYMVPICSPLFPNEGVSCDQSHQSHQSPPRCWPHYSSVRHPLMACPWMQCHGPEPFFVVAGARNAPKRMARPGKVKMVRKHPHHCHGQEQRWWNVPPGERKLFFFGWVFWFQLSGFKN